MFSSGKSSAHLYTQLTIKVAIALNIHRYLLMDDSPWISKSVYLFLPSFTRFTIVFTCFLFACYRTLNRKDWDKSRLDFSYYLRVMNRATDSINRVNFIYFFRNIEKDLEISIYYWRKHSEDLFSSCFPIVKKRARESSDREWSG